MESEYAHNSDFWPTGVFAPSPLFISKYERPNKQGLSKIFDCWYNEVALIFHKSAKSHLMELRLVPIFLFFSFYW